MSKKIVQFSTKQCSRCQVLKREIEKKLINSSIEYEYISLVDPNKVITRDNIREYWDEVYTNFEKYSNTYNVSLHKTLPSLMIINGDTKYSATTEQVFNYIKDNA